MDSTPDEIPAGASRRLARHRRIVLDVIRQAQSVPSFPVERWFDVGEVGRLRRQATSRVSWAAIFLRAYGLASRDIAVLRQTYHAWPWERIYQAPEVVLSLSINRETESGDQLYFARLRAPDRLSLLEIQAELDQYASGDVKRLFRQQHQASYLPTPLRRIGWWWRMQVDVKRRARRVGTGSMSVLAGQGVTNCYHPCMLTSSLSYGPQESDGRMWVTLQCDHRVLDGVAAARALNAVHEHLQQQVQAELRQLARVQLSA